MLAKRSVRRQMTSMLSVESFWFQLRSLGTSGVEPMASWHLIKSGQMFESFRPLSQVDKNQAQFPVLSSRYELSEC